MEEERELVWQVQTHVPRGHSIDWFWGLGALAVVGAAASIFFGNALFAVVLILGAGTIGFLAASQPREHMVAIGPRGISIDGTRYAYASIYSFWVEHEVENPRLFLSMKGILSPHYTLFLEDPGRGEQVRAYLKEFIKEEEQGPHMGEHLTEMFGL